MTAATTEGDDVLEEWVAFVEDDDDDDDAVPDGRVWVAVLLPLLVVAEFLLFVVCHRLTQSDTCSTSAANPNKTCSGNAVTVPGVATSGS
jgi:hypothetical protein